ncbi:GNAT family N-acetyltransferase [Cohaesibacter gelatinilyticus]|uniref:L-amino acid N-acyltransferase YncA n=1 Tax=Cohaesibacter gelatinilyticus TaxID=372072 RepID=A0A285PE15_9HYPH|nr:GNAT family N-acetyltransferase [Cohaesibacter gelatinilyticus]SNZ19994.1 L-amino acid N-acyltransferase YncA [Cohaesibacter gelatinilyticus]
MIIRPATEGDLPALLKLYRSLIPNDPVLDEDRAVEIFRQFHNRAMGKIYLGREEGQAVASCCLVIVPNLTRGGRPYALIENVVTHIEHRNKGYGKSIIRHACDQAFEQGCYKVMLMTGSQNPEVLRFYLAAGFVQDKTGFQMRNVPRRIE